MEIPDEAYEAASAAISDWPMASSDAYDCASTAVQAAAPLIVAAELDRLMDGDIDAVRIGFRQANRFNRASAVEHVQRLIRERAAELRAMTTDPTAPREKQ
jgi:hypothetical protein